MLKSDSISGNHYQCRPLFVDDKSLLFIAAGSAIHVASLVTGELICALKGYSGNVTSIALHPTLPDTVITSTIKGSVTVWNYETQIELHQIKLDIPVHEIIPSRLLSPQASENALPCELFMVVGAPEYTKMVIFNTESMNIRKHIVEMKMPINCSTLFTFSRGNGSTEGADSSDVDYVVVGAKSKLVLWGVGPSIERGAPNERIQASVTQCRAAITAVSCNHIKDLIVTGHEDGSMFLWNGVRHWIKEASLSTSSEHLTSSNRLTKAGTRFPPPPCTTLHWHSQTVSALQFSIDGALLYSGGKEGVLVVWQTMAAGERSFVPRLGGPIAHIAASCEEAKLAVSSTDNCLRVVHAASLRDEWCIRSACMGVGARGRGCGGLSLVDTDTFPSAGKGAKIRIECNSMTKQIACNGYPGQLQLLDVTTAEANATTTNGDSRGGDDETSSMRLPVSDTHQIVSYNRVSKMDNAVTARNKLTTQGALFVPSVTLFKYHSYRYALPSSHSKGKSTLFLHSHFLASVDVSRGEEFETESSLKIWKWTTSSGGRDRDRYKLVAQIDRPHDSSRVNSIVFLNCNNSSTESEALPVAGLITCGVNGSVKVWHCMVQPPGREKQQSNKKLSKPTVMAGLLDNAKWACAYSFTYRECRTGGLSVSLDDSVLAVGHGSLLTLWDPSTVEMKGKISLSSITGTSSTSSAAEGDGDGDDEGDGDGEVVIVDKKNSAKKNSFEVNSRNNITFTAVIEPKSALSDGGGCGEAYVVAATSVAVFVVDLLSLSVVWKVGGDVNGQFIHSIAACGEHSQIMRAPESNGEGWFAVCMTSPNLTDDDDSDVDKTTSEVSVFSPRSSEPVLSTTLSTIATSMIFWTTPATDPTRPISNVLLAATQSGEMMMMSSEMNSGDQNVFRGSLIASSPAEYATKRCEKSLPRLSEMEVRGESKWSSPTASTACATTLSTSEKAKSFLNSSSSFFIESSSKMPSVSALFDGYMRNALTKKRKLQDTTSGQEKNDTCGSETASSHKNKPHKKAKNNNFSDPQFRSKVNSQLFAAFSKPKGKDKVNGSGGKSINTGSANSSVNSSTGSKSLSKKGAAKSPSATNATATATPKKKLQGAQSDNTLKKKLKTPQDPSTPASVPASVPASATKTPKAKAKHTPNPKSTVKTGDSSVIKKMRSPKARAAKKKQL